MKRAPFVRVAVAAVILAVLAVVIALVRLGPWLVVEDPLRHASAIAVLNGENVRANEAARLYREGWAPEVWLTQILDRPDDAPRAARGEIVDSGTAFNVKLLLAGGVPREAIHVLPGTIGGTSDEVRLIAGELGRRHGDRVIVVTSHHHTRRARFLWRRIVGTTPEASVRGARETSDLRRWWRDPEERWLVRHELWALLYAAVFTSR